MLILAFNNCGEGFVAGKLTTLDSSSFIDNSIGLPSTGNLCEDALIKVYSNTYHPFLSQTCSGCHVSGPGVGTFASPEILKSYRSFANIGAARINTQAVNPLHKPPYTGTQHAASIEQIETSWASAQTTYAACASQNNGGGGGGDGGSGDPAVAVVKSNPLMVPANLATTFVRMEWDLETQSSKAVPLVLGIDIRKSVIGGVTRGYEFRNPTLRLKRADAGAYQARALNFYFNNELQAGMTTFSNVDINISATTNVSLAPPNSIALGAYTPASTDMIALEFSSLVPASPTPATVTYTQLAGAQGVFAMHCFSCHGGGATLGGLDMSTYERAKAAAANIKLRVNNANNPMPTSGLLEASKRDLINAWVDAGAPQ